MNRFLVKQLIQKDDGIGGMIEDLQTIYIGSGFLDMLTGSNQNTVQNAYVEQSTHLLITEYFDDYKQVIREQMVVDFDDSRYRITYVDNPTEYDDHLEIYLNFEQHITQDELIDDYLETLLSNIVVTKGEKGDPGRDGKDGKSAFELWSVQNSGTIADFFESLKGEKGDKGPKGDKGERGEIGPMGPQGENGRDGIDGLKGDKGEPFTYEDFTVEQLNSLKGPKGDKGEDGVDGRDGVDGVGIVQLLSLAGNVLSISDGNEVELPATGLTIVEQITNANGTYIEFSNGFFIILKSDYVEYTVQSNKNTTGSNFNLPVKLKDNKYIALVEQSTKTAHIKGNIQFLLRRVQKFDDRVAIYFKMNQYDPTETIYKVTLDFIIIGEV